MRGILNFIGKQPLLSGAWAYFNTTAGPIEPYGNPSTYAGTLAEFTRLKQLGFSKVAADCFATPALLDNALEAAMFLELSLTPIISTGVLQSEGATQPEIVAALIAAINEYLETIAPFNSCCTAASNGDWAVWIYGTANLSLANWALVQAGIAESWFPLQEIPGNAQAIPGGMTVEDFINSKGGVPAAGQYFSFFPIQDIDIEEYAAYVAPAPLTWTNMAQYQRYALFTGFPPDGGVRTIEQWNIASSPQIQASTVLDFSNDAVVPNGDGSNFLGYTQPDSEFGDQELLTAEGLLQWDAAFGSAGSLTATGLSAVCVGSILGGVGMNRVVLGANGVPQVTVICLGRESEEYVFDPTAVPGVGGGFNPESHV